MTKKLQNLSLKEENGNVVVNLQSYLDILIRVCRLGPTRTLLLFKLPKQSGFS